MRAAIYTRVSQDTRGEARSVAEQEAECAAWVAREGWDAVGVWTDNDVSASRYTKKARPGWQALQDTVHAGKVDVIVVWEPSRATRDRLVWATLAATCQDRGVRIGVNGRLYDLEDPDDAFQLDLFFALATRESGTTRKRVLRSTKAAAAAGRPHGKMLYGYARTYREGRGGPELVAQVIAEDKAAVVREAARRVVAGESLARIARDFDARGIAPPRGGAAWDATQVKRLCINPGYIAKRVHQGKVVGDALWPPILDEGTFYAAVSRLTDPARRTNEGRAARHWLAGVAVCGVCGGRLHVQKNRTHYAYICSTGFHVSRERERLESFVRDVVIGRLALPDLADLLTDDDDGAVRAAEDEVTELRSRLEGFYDEAAEGNLTPAALARIEARLLPQIEDAEKRTRRVHASPLLASIAGPDAADAWDALAVEQKREVVSLLCDVRVLKTERGQRVFDPDRVEVAWKVA
jgi:DNA invertase Pin-like site-specific DNA recombinase